MKFDFNENIQKLFSEALMNELEPLVGDEPNFCVLRSAFKTMDMQKSFPMGVIATKIAFRVNGVIWANN